MGEYEPWMTALCSCAATLMRHFPSFRVTIKLSSRGKSSVKQELGLMDTAWSGFIKKVRRMARYRMEPEAASSFFEDLLLQKNGKALSKKAQREHEAINALFGTAPGQELITAKETLWGGVNAVTYYTDHVRSGAAGDRLDSAWFGAGYALKGKAWAKADVLVS
jgi:hypothetical protein